MRQIVSPNEQKANKQQIPPTEQESHSFISTLFQKQYQIIKTPKHFAILLTILGILFFVLGIVTLVLSLKVKNVQVDYATMRKCKGTNIEGEKCSVKFNVEEDMEGPVYLLYSIKNVYINHRKFLNSYSPDQLKGKTISSTQATQLCGNFVYNRNIPQKNSWSGDKLNQDDIASLCGVKPQGFFNDTYALYLNGEKIPIDESKAYTGSTIETHRQPKSDQSQWIDPENLHFKQYLLDGSLMTKRRVWGAINNGLKAGDYDLLVQNNYQMANMKIIKGILLSTSTVMGGKIFFFPVVFFMLTVTCIGLNLYLFFRFRNYSKLKQHDKLYQS